METIRSYEVTYGKDVVFHPTKPWIILNGFSGISIWDEETNEKVEFHYPQTPCDNDDNTYILDGCLHISSALDITSDGEIVVFSQGNSDIPVYAHLYHIGDESVYATIEGVGVYP